MQDGAADREACVRSFRGRRHGKRKPIISSESLRDGRNVRRQMTRRKIYIIKEEKRGGLYHVIVNAKN